MPSNTYFLYHTATATGAGKAYITLPRKGNIKSVQWAITRLSPAGATSKETHLLTVGPTDMSQVNDAQNVVSIVGVANNVASSSVAVSQCHLVGKPVQAGDRLYLHINTDQAFTSGYVQCLVTVDE